MSAGNQFQLLRQQRFAPLFWVQFFGAANDNVFKFAFTLLATYSASRWGNVDPKLAGFLIAGLFIAPFMLFSATSGQLADRLEKSRFIRRVKDAEIAVMLIAAAGFLLQWPWLLYLAIFLMGLQSTVFGPVKYAYLPQHLDAHEITGGNGLVEMGTFVAILLGTIGGGFLINAFGDAGAAVTAIAIVVLAVLGRVAAHFIPLSPAADPALTINWNPFTETWANLNIARANPAVFNSILGISWLWFFGSVFLTSFTPFARENLGADEAVVTLLLAVFSVGIGAGSLLTERLSGRKVEVGLVPLGSLGMSVFAVDLYFASRGFAAMQSGSIADFLSHPGAARIVIDLAGLALFAGLYSVPLYALVQSRAEKTHIARIIASNNILNAIFMVVAAIGAGLLLASGLTLPQLFLLTGILNALVALYIFRLVPEFVLRFVAWLLAHTLYRVRTFNVDRIPERGAAVLVCNHVSFVDAIILMGISPRPIRFVMDHRIFKVPLLSWFFRQAKAIPIATARDDPALLAEASRRIEDALDEGELVCIFPEGRITSTGEIAPFRQGVRRIVERSPVPVVPLALRGLWGSFFSRFGGDAFKRPIEARLQRGIRSKIEVVVGEAVPPDDALPELLMDRVQALRGSEL